MDNFLFSVNAVLPLFLLMATGFGLRYTKIGSNEFFAKANTLCFKVLLPVMLFVNIYELTPTEGADLRYIWLALFGTLAIALAGMIILPFVIRDRKKIGVIAQAFFRSNFLIFGVPMVRNMFGESELWATSVLLPLVIPLFNVLAVIVLSIYLNEDHSINGLKGTLIGILKNPLILGAIFAYIVKLSGITIPAPIFSAAESLGSMASPLALLALGGTLKFSTMGKNFRHLITACGMKLLVTPALTIPVAIAMGFRGSTIGALLALFASPVAVSSYVMAEASGNDGELAGQIVAISTVASILTMFIWVYALKSCGVL